MNASQTCGRLYVVATPIGNLEDITLRALRILREVDIVAAEDTRHTRKLLSHYDIHTLLMSCHEHSTEPELTRLVKRLESGADIALVSDAGTPGVSDPGAALIREALAVGAEIVPIPGASALLAALNGSGLPMDRFRFAGFLPRKGKERQAALDELRGATETTVVFEAPNRLEKTLKELAETLGPRPACAARELTKIHEEFIRAPLPELVALLPTPVKGECCIVIGGAEQPEGPVCSEDEWTAELERLVASGVSRRDAAGLVSAKYGISRKAAYAAAANQKD